MIRKESQYDYWKWPRWATFAVCSSNRSHVHRLTVPFDEPVNVAGPGAMTLHNTNNESVMWGEFFFVEALSKVVTETK